MVNRKKIKQFSILVCLTIITCFSFFPTFDAHAMGGHGGIGLEKIIKKHLARYRAKHVTLSNPVLISPEGEITTKRPVYQWYPVAGANRYGLIVHRVTLPQIPVYIKFNIPKTRKRQPWWKRLKYNIDYFFVVVAYNTKTRKRSPISEKWNL